MICFDEFTKLVKHATADDTIQFVIQPHATLIAADRIAVVYHKAPTDQTRGDFEDGGALNLSENGGNLDIPEINLEMRSEAIVAKTRKLKAVWSPEFAQDLTSFF